MSILIYLGFLILLRFAILHYEYIIHWNKFFMRNFLVVKALETNSSIVWNFSAGKWRPLLCHTPTSPELKVLWTILGMSRSDVPVWRPGDILYQSPWDVPWKTFSGRPLVELQKTSYRDDIASYDRCLWIFFSTFFPNLFDWSNLTRNNTIIRGVFRAQWRF